MAPKLLEPPSSSSSSNNNNNNSSSTNLAQDEFTQLYTQLSQIRAGITSIVRNVRDATVSILTSRHFQRGVISTVLLVIATVFLYGIAVVGYAIFYYAYLPDMVREVPVHLQYGWGVNPFGVVITEQGGRELFQQRQSYDVLVELTLPKTIENGRKGNWMVVMHWLAEGETASQQQKGGSWGLGGGGGGDTRGGKAPMYYFGAAAGEQKVGGGDLVTTFSLGGYVRDKKLLGTAARAAIVPYEDALVSAAGRLLFLPWHIFFPRQAEAVTLKIAMAEGLRFERGETLPKSLVLELQAGQGLQVYSAKVVLVAQLRGLRYLMYRWRLTTFFVITGGFWVMEVVLMCVAALVMGYWLSGRTKDPLDGNDAKLFEGDDVQVKKEDGEGEGMSDTERTFPTASSTQPALKYESSSNETRAIKKEEEGEEEEDVLIRIPDFGVEGDDEEDGEGSGFRDSGIGTSYSDAARGVGGARRRNVSKGRVSG
ncbi:putative adipose-regulatory protein-domain-containing protein [Podospora australis]|uniref:Adipose-regulatory protein-domain-containing protein n=1 Tax=Podospora australis TaxID=1536484 RepID=A0AAN6WYK5_9PEZI|nr:putative adipose-regulatory protein-domain-containing protein [Podospora australis]